MNEDGWGVRVPVADVSVVIPFFNSAQTLGRALKSVAGQTRAVREIIVVDDASEESQSREANELVREIPCGRYIRLAANAGPGEARNVGWDAAQATWVAFLDSDDAWHPRKIELQLAIIEEAERTPVLVASKCAQIETLDDFAPLDMDALVVEQVKLKHFLVRNQFVTSSSVMILRTTPIRFPKGRRYSEDYETWIGVCATGRPLLRINLPLVAMFKRPFGHSGLSSATWRMIQGEYLAFWSAYGSGKVTLVHLSIAWCAITLRAARRLAILAYLCLRK